MLEILIVLVVIILILGLLGREIVKEVRNPDPIFCNGDKRISTINKIKTRVMYDGIER